MRSEKSVASTLGGHSFAAKIIRGIMLILVTTELKQSSPKMNHVSAAQHRVLTWCLQNWATKSIGVLALISKKAQLRTNACADVEALHPDEIKQVYQDKQRLGEKK